MSALGDDLLRAVAAEHGTPTYVYDLDRVAVRAGELAGFDVVRYAVKANACLAVLARLRAAGVALDVVSAGEVERAFAAGYAPADLVYTADLFDRDALEAVARHGLHVNVGSADMLEQYAAATGGGAVTLRVNPGFGEGHDRKVTTGGPHSKHGVWHADVPAAVGRARAAGLRVRGLHVHVGSGTELALLDATIEALDRCVDAVAADLETVSAGGGLPVPYRPDDVAPDVPRYVAAWRAARDRWSERVGRRLVLETEPGRFLVADAGVLVTEVRATKRTVGPEGPLEWVLVDAGFHTLARPMLYGAFHRVRALGRDGEPTAPRVVAGPLCEAADVLTQDKDGSPAPRPLPAVAVGDLLAVHDVGAYGAAMASGYNGRPLPPEVVVESGRARLARPREDQAPRLAAERALLGE